MINLHNLKLPLKKGFLPFSLTFQPHYFASQGFDVAKDYYKILGVSQSATDKQIKAAYFSLAKKYHPDVNKGNADRFKEISDAYSIIGEANKRKDYDAARKYASSNSGFGSNTTSQSQQSYGRTSNTGYSQYGQNSGYYNNNQQQQQHIAITLVITGKTAVIMRNLDHSGDISTLTIVPAIREILTKRPMKRIFKVSLG